MRPLFSAAEDVGEYGGGNYFSTTKFPGRALAHYNDRVQVLTLLAHPLLGHPSLLLGHPD